MELFMPQCTSDFFDAFREVGFVYRSMQMGISDTFMPCISEDEFTLKRMCIVEAWKMGVEEWLRPVIRDYTLTGI